VLLDNFNRTRCIIDFYRSPRCHEIEAIHRFIVLAHIIEASGRAGVVVEGYARRDAIDAALPIPVFALLREGPLGA